MNDDAIERFGSQASPAARREIWPEEPVSRWCQSPPRCGFWVRFATARLEGGGRVIARSRATSNGQARRLRRTAERGTRQEYPCVVVARRFASGQRRNAP